MAMQADDVFSHVCENVYETRVRECLCVCVRERDQRLRQETCIMMYILVLAGADPDDAQRPFHL